MPNGLIRARLFEPENPGGRCRHGGAVLVGQPREFVAAPLIAGLTMLVACVVAVPNAQLGKLLVKSVGFERPFQGDARTVGMRNATRDDELLIHEAHPIV